MTKITVVSNPTFRELNGRFARANKKLLEIRREELRGEGQFLVKLVRRKLAKKTAPYSSAKLGKGVRFNTRSGSDSVRLSVTAPSKAGPHRIAAKNAKALAFNFKKAGMVAIVPKKGGFRTHVRGGKLWVGKGYVDHPGGSLAPLFVPILSDASDEWTRSRGRVVLNRISTRYLVEVEK